MIRNECFKSSRITDSSKLNPCQLLLVLTKSLCKWPKEMDFFLITCIGLDSKSVRQQSVFVLTCVTGHTSDQLHAYLL